jgi:hypothetical protein
MYIIRKEPISCGMNIRNRCMYVFMHVFIDTLKTTGYARIHKYTQTYIHTHTYQFKTTFKWLPQKIVYEYEMTYLMICSGNCIWIWDDLWNYLLRRLSCSQSCFSCFIWPISRGRLSRLFRPSHNSLRICLLVYTYGLANISRFSKSSLSLSLSPFLHTQVSKFQRKVFWEKVTVYGATYIHTYIHIYMQSMVWHKKTRIIQLFLYFPLQSRATHLCIIRTSDL